MIDAHGAHDAHIRYRDELFIRAVELGCWPAPFRTPNGWAWSCTCPGLKHAQLGEFAAQITLVALQRAAYTGAKA